MAEQNKDTRELPKIDLRPAGRGGPGMNARMNAEKPKNTLKTLSRVLKYIGSSRYILIMLILFTLLITAVDLVGPMMQQKAIDTFRIDETTGGLSVNLSQLLGYLLILGIIALVGAVFTWIQGRVSAKLSMNTVYVMREELFAKISRLPIGYTDSHKHGDIMSRMTNDVENLSTAVSQSLTSLLSAVLTLVGAFSMMLYYSPVMTLVAVVTIPLTVFVSSMLAKFMRKYFTRRQRLLGQLNGQVEEMVTGYKTVVAYGKEPEAIENFGKVSEEFRSCSISARVWGSIMGPVMNFIGNFQYVLLAAAGGYLILTGKAGMTPGKIQAMLQYSKKFTHPINMIASQYSSILTALAGAERIFAILDTPDEIDEGKKKIDISSVRGEIRFEHVDFGYVPGEPVLRDLDLSVGAGQKVAIVGATGSGKTTIVNLLTRFYEVDSGRITVDGTDITEIPKKELRQSIAIVLQDTVLFNDTIEKNIKYGNLSATDSQMRAAAHTARADSFIDRLPDGYRSELSEAGGNLSQGQRQLLSIARAVLADPRILILDEATSSVDTRTEMHIQQAMVALMQGRTSLIIAHRLSTIRDADKIVVLRDGKIAETGSHEELLAKKGEYFKLYSSQFAGIAT